MEFQNGTKVGLLAVILGMYQRCKYEFAFRIAICIIRYLCLIGMTGAFAILICIEKQL